MKNSLPSSGDPVWSKNPRGAKGDMPANSLWWKRTQGYRYGVTFRSRHTTRKYEGAGLQTGMRSTFFKDVLNNVPRYGH